MPRVKYISSSCERRISTILKPRYHRLFIADMNNMLRGKGEHMNSILEKYYDSLTPIHQKQLLEDYDYWIKKNKIKQ
jgi:hypothetical protein